MEANSKRKSFSRLHLRRPGESAVNLWDVSYKAVLLLIGAAFLGLMFVIFVPVYRDVARFRTALADKQTAFDREQARQKDLLRELQLLKTSPEYNERIAREKLKLAKPGETVFVFPPLPATNAAPAAVPAKTASQ